MCVVKQLPVYCWEQKGNWLYIRTILVARATLPLSATHNTIQRGKQQRRAHYGKLQYDADWSEVLTEGKKSPYRTN
jgi:hypothetical protein